MDIGSILERLVFQQSWVPIVAGAIYLLLRRLLKSLLPDGYYFRFMDRWIKKGGGNGNGNGKH